MAKEAPKPKKPAGKIDQSTEKKPTTQKAVKAAAKPEKQPAKAARPASKATAAKPISKSAQAAAKAAPKGTKKVPAKNAKGRAKKISRGDQMYCDVCGLVVTVDETCGCAACDIICCGTEMQAR